MARSYKLASFVFLALGLALPASVATAQIHFSDCVSLTGNSSTILISTTIGAKIGNDPLDTADEIAVYTPDGACAGAAVWSGKNLSLSVWGNNSMTTEKESFETGETMSFRIWDASANKEYSNVSVSYSSAQPYYRNEGTYAEDAIYVLVSLVVPLSTPTGPMVVAPATGATGVSLAPTLQWQASAGSATFDLHVATDSAFTSMVFSFTGLTSTSQSLNSLSEATRYFWRVRSVVSGNASPYTVASFTTLSKQSIAIKSGWNFISSRVAPSSPKMSNVFGDVLSSVVLVKDYDGKMLYPEYSIDEIGDWDAEQAYMVYASDDASLNLSGSGASLEAPIALKPGWNSTAYWPSSALDVASALSSIEQNVVLVKNGAGQVWMPEFDLNSIGSMKPGAGYLVYVERNSNLIYSSTAGKGAHTEEISEVEDVAFTGTLVVQADLPDGDIVTAHAAGREVGRGTMEAGKALLVLYGDDPMTAKIVEGALEGERIDLKRGAVTLSVESYRDIFTRSHEESLRYKTNGAWVAQVEAGDYSEMPQEYQLEANYPNPFNPTTTIRYALPEAADVRIEVINALGQRVTELVAERQDAGNHQVQFDAAGLPSGVYVYRLRAGSFSQVRQMILVK